MSENNVATAGCGCFLITVIINLLIGGFCFDYTVWFIINKDFPWYVDAICGLIGGELFVPLAIICFILNMFGVQHPLM